MMTKDRMMFQTRASNPNKDESQNANNGKNFPLNNRKEGFAYVRYSRMVQQKARLWIYQG